MNSYFYNKIVLITGGASGIGNIMGRLVLERGGSLVIWDINTELMNSVASEFEHLGTVKTYKVDVSKPEEIKEMAQKVKQDVGFLDVVINNAGIVVGKFFHEHTEAEILRTMDINAVGPMLVAHAFLPEMVEQNSGYICNIASSAGLISNPKMAVYVASKWAVIGFSDSLRLDLKKLKKNIGVTTVTPFYIKTGMFEGVKSIIPLIEPEDAARQIIDGIEAKKAFVSMPWSVRFVRFGQALLSVNQFDKYIGGWGGIYKTMDKFTGRKS